MRYTILIWAMFLLLICLPTKAGSKEDEITPYAFAELPHGGTIYKAVHEGCELFIVEGYERIAGSGDYGRSYAIATGRGCK